MREMEPKSSYLENLQNKAESAFNILNRNKTFLSIFYLLLLASSFYMTSYILTLTKKSDLDIRNIENLNDIDKPENYLPDLTKITWSYGPEDKLLSETNDSIFFIHKDKVYWQEKDQRRDPVEFPGIDIPTFEQISGNSAVDKDFFYKLEAEYNNQLRDFTYSVIKLPYTDLEIKILTQEKPHDGVRLQMFWEDSKPNLSSDFLIESVESAILKTEHISLYKIHSKNTLVGYVLSGYYWPGNVYMTEKAIFIESGSPYNFYMAKPGQDFVNILPNHPRYLYKMVFDGEDTLYYAAQNQIYTLDINSNNATPVLLWQEQAERRFVSQILLSPNKENLVISSSYGSDLHPSYSIKLLNIKSRKITLVDDISEFPIAISADNSKIFVRDTPYESAWNSHVYYHQINENGEWSETSKIVDGSIWGSKSSSWETSRSGEIAYNDVVGKVPERFDGYFINNSLKILDPLTMKSRTLEVFDDSTNIDVYQWAPDESGIYIRKTKYSDDLKTVERDHVEFYKL